MYVRNQYSRFEYKELWSDSRLVNAAPNFCLCANCRKSQISKGTICPKHEDFMQMTQKLELSAPIFACGDFSELTGYGNSLNQYYDGECLSKNKSGALYTEQKERIRNEWEAQQKLWDESKLKNEIEVSL